jgi:hypothetical protein
VPPSRPTNEYFRSRKYIRLQNIKRTRKGNTTVFTAILNSVFFCTFKERAGSPRGGSVVRGTDPRIRIRIKMSRIRNTCTFLDFSCPSHCLYVYCVYLLVHYLSAFFFSLYISTNVTCTPPPLLLISRRSASPIRIRNERRGSYFRELKNNFLVKLLKFFYADSGPGMEIIRIWGFYPGSAKLRYTPG